VVSGGDSLSAAGNPGEHTESLASTFYPGTRSGRIPILMKTPWDGVRDSGGSGFGKKSSMQLGPIVRI
jgi:hypothetical protein